MQIKEHREFHTDDPVASHDWTKAGFLFLASTDLDPSVRYCILEIEYATAYFDIRGKERDLENGVLVPLNDV